MNMINKTSLFLFSSVLAASASAGGEWVLFDRSGWNFSAGPVFDSGVKTSLRCTYDAVAPYVTPYSVGLTAADADDLAKNGTPVSATRRIYAGGGWIDVKDDTTGMYGPGSKHTGYYHIPGAPGEVNAGSVFSLGTVPYAEVSVSGGRPGSFTDKDTSPLPGVALELTHGLYRDGENQWGVDLGFAFQYFIRRNVFKASRSWRNSSVVTEGGYESKIDVQDAYLSDDPAEDWNWGSGYYGVPADGGDGSYAGVIDGEGVYSELAWSGVRSDSSKGSFYAKADYENLEMMFLLRPYYDISDWFRVFGTVGAVVSRQNLEFTATVADGAQSKRYARHIHDWDVYGVAGLGARARCGDVTLSLEFLARFFDHDMNVRSDCVNGEVERGDWMARLMLGYEF